jgi:Zn finger protein HypA/HybF involved in hydrogenase expression
MNAKCCECNESWNISIFTDLTEEYICPKCKAKERRISIELIRQIQSKKSEGRIPNVLQRNRNKLFISNS